MMKIMTDAEVWKMVEEWVALHKGAVSCANAKYGWIHGADGEDTLQDIMLCCFKTIRLLEQDALSKGISPEWETNGTKKLLTNRTIGHYRANAWGNRGIENLRQSDLYNIEPGSEEDCKVQSNNIDDVEAWGIFAPVEYNHFNDDEPDAADVFGEDEMTECIVNMLVSILPANKPVILTETYLGGDHGILTHQETGDKTVLTRSAVTKSVKAAKQMILKFCEANGLTLDMPRKELHQKVQHLTAYYKAARRAACKNSTVVELSIMDFLESSAEQYSELHKIKKRKKTRRGRKIGGKGNRKQVEQMTETFTVADYIKMMQVI